MGMKDKAKNTVDKVVGSAKETVGKHTDDDELQAEGKADRAKGDLKNAGENVKDAFKK